MATPTRADDAARYRDLTAARPGDRVAWHNLAAAEGDLGRVREAEDAARRAIALGIRAPETRLVLARALQGQRRLDDAGRAFEEAIGLRPDYVDAHRDLAQLVWMRTGDAGAALRRLDVALDAHPRAGGLHLVRAIVLEFAGDPEGALAAIECGLAQAPADAALLKQAAHLAGELGRADAALDFARRSGDGVAQCEALLAAGRVDEADAIASRLHAAEPFNQYFLALQATAWRLRGDARHAALCDYASLVDTQMLETPPGFASLDAFLEALAAELESLHAFQAHPLQQSVRGGSQLHLQRPELERPLVHALFDAIVAAVHRHVQQLGRGRDPLRARNTGRFGLSGAWSVRLRSGGHHADHVHPHGWISSACYIRVPPTVGRQGGEGDRAGWLRLGKPGVRTVPPVEAAHYVRPVPGRLVLFPAYLWHGVEPFESDEPRLSVAFDVVPA